MINKREETAYLKAAMKGKDKNRKEDQRDNNNNRQECAGTEGEGGKQLIHDLEEVEEEKGKNICAYKRFPTSPPSLLMRLES